MALWFAPLFVFATQPFLLVRWQALEPFLLLQNALALLLGHALPLLVSTPTVALVGQGRCSQTQGAENDNEKRTRR